MRATAIRAGDAGVIPARWWHVMGDGRVSCDLCPRGCKLREGQRGFCYVRGCVAGEGMMLGAYGRVTGFAVDPVEKKPLHHYYPGTTVLSFGTVGCNLGCRFCQNWEMSKARDDDRMLEPASPDRVAELCVRAGCMGVAFTYNDPVIYAEYVIDCARAVRARGLRSVAVTAGYIGGAARREFFGAIDAANLDLKAFDGGFYRRLCLAEIGPVLETLRWVRAETDVWLEVTTLLIPGENDSDEEMSRLSGWLVENLGADTPLHLSAFHPAYLLIDRPRTPAETLLRARERAMAIGLRHVYVGNIVDTRSQTTRCARCGGELIAREGYRVAGWGLDRAGCCRACGERLPGWFGPGPGEWD